MRADGAARLTRLSWAPADLLRIDPQFERRERCRQAVVTAIGVRQWVLGDLTYAIVAVAACALLPAGHALNPPAAIAATALFIAAALVVIPLNVGAAALIQPAFVLMLFVVPLNAVLVIVALCEFAGAALRRKPLESLALTPGDCWFAVPPTLILALAAPGPASWEHWPVYAAAFGAQFGFDFAVAAGRRAMLGHHGTFDPSTLLTPIAVDACLTPIGLAAAVWAPRAPGASVAMVAGVIGIAAMFGHERADRLRQQQEALHDPLTGLANRILFDDLLNLAARRCEHGETSGALLLLDLNRFKEINDSRGHRCGDAVLKAFAERLRSCVRDADTVARIGGDEFAVLLADPTSLDAARTLAGKLRDAFSAPLTITGVGELAVSASTGAAVMGAGISPARALAEADIAMYSEKQELSRCTR